MIRLLSTCAALVLAAACSGSSFSSDDGGSGGGGGTSGSGSSAGGSSSSSGGTTATAGSGGRAGSAGSAGSTNSSGGSTSSSGGTGGVVSSTGGSNTTGGSISNGGTGTGMAGASGVDCDMLVADYLAKANATRDCNPNSGDTQCNHDWTMVGPCACNVYYNGASSSDEIDARDAAYDALTNAGCEIADCGICPVLLDMPQCLLEEGSLDRYVCRDAG